MNHSHKISNYSVTFRKKKVINKTINENMKNLNDKWLLIIIEAILLFLIFRDFIVNIHI